MKNYIHKVKYYETDKMGITHHSNYIRWMEEARIDFLDQIGCSYFKLEEQGIISPVIGIECNYKNSTTFDDEVEIEVKVKEFKGVKLIFEYVMTNKKTNPSGELEKSINRDFGSFDKFKEEFKKAALDVFGSGWAWLVSDNKGNLCIIKTSNQDTPISQNLRPIIGIDVWEHAYYLRYQNNRGNYIDNWFNVVNWDKALSNYNNIK